MSTVHITPSVRKAPKTTHPATGSTAAAGPRRRAPLSRTVRNLGIMLDTAARVVFLGRDGVKL